MTQKAPLTRGLSARLLALTVVCLLIGEIMIFVPSVARFRYTYLQERIAQAHLATLVPAHRIEEIEPTLESALLSHTDAEAINVMSGNPELMLGSMVEAERIFYVSQDHWMKLIIDAFDTLLFGGDRVIAVRAEPPRDPTTMIEVILPDRMLRMEMIDYAFRILILSLILSAITASLTFFVLQSLIVKPLVRLTEDLAHFRANPGDESSLRPASNRSDEIGIVQRETARMQHDLRVALATKTRLAGIGEAVSKLNHDLRNILSTAILISDRLERSEDPTVQREGPRLARALERALKLCAASLDFARSRPNPLQLEPVSVRSLIQNVFIDLGLPSEHIDVSLHVPANVALLVDRDELQRCLLNLIKNSMEAISECGEIKVIDRLDQDSQHYVIEITDNGPGLPEAMHDRIFEPFAHRSQKDGSGLGLAIAKEIMKRHGGDLVLLSTSVIGVSFALKFPQRTLLPMRLEKGMIS